MHELKKEMQKQFTREEMQKIVDRMQDESLEHDRNFRPSGIIRPNSTQQPNETYDFWMSFLTGAQWKILCYIIRKTYGYGKYEGDWISAKHIAMGTKKSDGTYIDYGTGLNASTVVEEANKLATMKLIIAKKEKDERGNNLPTFYKLNDIEGSRDPKEMMEIWKLRFKRVVGKS